MPTFFEEDLHEEMEEMEAAATRGDDGGNGSGSGRAVSTGAGGGGGRKKGVTLDY